MSLYFRNLVLPTLLLGTVISPLSASQIDAIYAFGDSLSDAGNVYSLTGIPTTPYSGGRFSNGPVWVQDLSASLGLGPLTASRNGGTDFAYGDASTGVTPVHPSSPTSFIDLTGATGQVGQFHEAVPVADPNALYTIWIGSNDLSDILTHATPANYAADAAAAVANIDSAINTLAGFGAKNFLILTVPDLGKTPDAITAGPLAVAASSGLSAAFDLALVDGSAAASLPSLSQIAAGDHLNLSVLDTYSLIDGIVAHPGAYGFSDVTQGCVTPGPIPYVDGTDCSDPSQYLFWDGLHPTEGGHALVADAALGILAAPEPASMALLGTGLLGLCLMRRKRA
jgi:phospholipase/lecithinase/hemolysin